MSIFFKVLFFIHSLNSFFKRKILIKDIKKEDLVLDVGSGDKPFWRADVIVDKYLDDNQQRNSGSVILDNRKLFLNSDVENLPFKDKVFDFVFCSHLLEHVENPDKAISELTRVAKKGYIEVPSVIVDILRPFPSHLWFCEYDRGVLIFHQKENKDNFYLKNIKKFGEVFFDKNIFQYLLSKNYKNIFISLYWKDSVKFRLEKSKDRYIYQQEEKQPKKSRIPFLFYKIFYIIITTLFYKEKNISLARLTK